MNFNASGRLSVVITGEPTAPLRVITASVFPSDLIVNLPDISASSFTPSFFANTISDVPLP